MRHALGWISASAILAAATLVAMPTARASILVSGLDGLEFIAIGPGGAFGDGLYLPTLGTDTTRGAVYVLSRDRTLSTFLPNIDAASVAFDVNGVLGGGMFVADLGRHGAAGKIYRVRPDGAGGFSVTLFSDFSVLPGEPRRKPLALNMLISDGSNGFVPGMYVSSGPAPDARSDKLIHVDPRGLATVVRGGFAGNEGLVFAEGAYGEGMLISEPYSHTIVRLHPDGTLTDFASLSIPSFGPAGLAYGSDGILYATSFTGGEVLRVLPDGSSQVIGKVAISTGGGSKAVFADMSGAFCGSPTSLLVGTFTLVPEPRGLDTVNCVAIPEPGNLATLLLGLGATWILRRRHGATSGT